MSEHTGIPPTCGCTDYGVHRALKRLDYERNAGRISARELGGEYKKDYDRRVAAAEAALKKERKLAAKPGRINPTPGQLLKEVREAQERIDRLMERPGLFTRIGAAMRAFCNPSH